MMTDKYRLRDEIKKLKVEMWNLKVKGTDVVSYNKRFQELALMCARMFPEESDKIEKYVDANDLQTEYMEQEDQHLLLDVQVDIRGTGVVYALGGGETNQDPNNIEDEIEA
ncbi:hypothetical protein Tco_1221593 [Tanacetum coccineum]